MYISNFLSHSTARLTISKSFETHGEPNVRNEGIGLVENYDYVWTVDADEIILKKDQQTIIDKLDNHDAVFISVLDYADADDTLVEIHRVLKKDGILHILVPHYLSPYHIQAALLGRHKKRRFLIYEIGRLVYKAGFKRDNMQLKGFCFWVPGAYLQRVLFPLYFFLDSFLGWILGNNIYMRVRKIEQRDS